LGIKCTSPAVTVLINGAPGEAKINTHSELSVTLEKFDAAAIYEISVDAAPLDELTETKRALIKRLKKVQGSFAHRSKILQKTCALNDMARVIGYIMLSDLKDIEKKRLTEVLLDF